MTVHHRATRFDTSLLTLSTRGRISAVHRRAALVALEPGSGLLTLVAGDHGLVPWGIAGPRLALQVGQQVQLSGRRLQIRGSGTFVLLGPGTRLDIEPDPLSPDGLHEQLDSYLPPARIQLIVGGSPDATDSLQAELMGSSKRRLGRVVTALRTGDDEGLDRAVGSLVGLGPGSSPTGDDLLVGLAAAAHRLAGAGLLPRQRVRALAASFDAHRGRTTAVGSEMLRHAGEGRFLEPLKELAGILGTPQEIHGRARTLIAVGGHSGADLLAGFLAGCGTVQRWPPR